MTKWLVIALIAIPTVASAQNPCTQPLPPGVILGTNSKVVAALTAQNTVASGVPVVSQYRLGVFLPGVDPNTGAPVSQVVMTKTTFTLITGTPDCYEAPPPTEMLAIPINVDRFFAIRAERITPDKIESAWSTISNPFSRLGPPPVPSGVRVTP